MQPWSLGCVSLSDTVVNYPRFLGQYRTNEADDGKGTVTGETELCGVALKKGSRHYEETVCCPNRPRNADRNCVRFGGGFIL